MAWIKLILGRLFDSFVCVVAVVAFLPGLALVGLYYLLKMVWSNG